MQDYFIIGHRGAAGEKFENSLSGFEHALSLDIDAVELDIRVNGGELWVIHDNDLQRLTGAEGRFEETSSPERLRLSNGEYLPKLAQVLDLYWGKMPVNIEIKSADAFEPLLALLDLYPPIESESSFPWILISSFDHRQMAELRRRSSRWPLAPILSDVPKNSRQLIDEIQPYSMHFDDDHINLELIGQLRQLGIKSFVYTVNHDERARELKASAVDGIFTDYPSRLLELRVSGQA